MRRWKSASPGRAWVGRDLAGRRRAPRHPGARRRRSSGNGRSDRRRQCAGGHVEHVQHRLVAAAGELVGQPPALQVGQPAVQRRQPGFPLRAAGRAGRGARRPAPVTQHRVLLARLAAGGEPAAGPPQWRRHRPGFQQVPDLLGEGGAAGQGVEVALGEAVLGGRPRDGARVVGVLEPAVGVGDAVAVQLLDESSRSASG